MVNALAFKKPHVPFRDSRLTTMLGAESNKLLHSELLRTFERLATFWDMRATRDPQTHINTCLALAIN